MDGVIENLKIDESRVYATGFSNGNAFVLTRVLVELNDRFAAVAGSAQIMMNEFEIEGNLLPAVTTMGTKDGKLLAIHPDSSIPFSIQGILNDPVIRPFMDSTLYSLRLSNNFTIDSTLQTITFHFEESVDSGDNEWHFTMVNCIGHVYPNGENNPWNLVVAPIFWDFFQRFKIEDNSTSVDEEDINLPCPIPTLISETDLDLSCFIATSHDPWSILITDISGNTLMRQVIDQSGIDAQRLPKGVLLFSFFRNGQLVNTSRVIKI